MYISMIKHRLLNRLHIIQLFNIKYYTDVDASLFACGLNRNNKTIKEEKYYPRNEF